ncbi:hypothetical protein [Guptibacillus spartinae]|uniref:hypothetical protein n=1 Tax=Guptibacillus spartinae TaxID=3025679 RepID=UPI002361629A|nr:hypothetical protein [Pseudalkalibacillus spartinae]
MKKILIILLSTLLFVPQISYAASSSNQTWTLVDEVWDGAGVSRTYINKDKKQHYVFLPVPEKSIKTISSNENPLLEAKKILALGYIQQDYNERFSELMNDYLLPFNTKPELSKELKESFYKDENKIYSYIKENLEKPSKYSFDENTFGNFSDRLSNFSDLNDYSFKSVKDYVDNFKPHTFNNNKESDSNEVLYFGIIISILITFLVLWIKKPRR